MRGADGDSESLFTTVKLHDVVPASHPLRPIRAWVNDALAKMDAKFMSPRRPAARETGSALTTHA